VSPFIIIVFKFGVNFSASENQFPKSVFGAITIDGFLTLLFIAKRASV
jgi:hypothetical protein